MPVNLTSKKNPPFKAFRFLIEIEGTGACVGAFTNFSGISMKQQIFKARVGSDIRGVKDNYPGITEFEHVTLTKGVIGDNDFLNWLFNSTFPGAFLGPMGLGSYRNLNIVALTDRGERGIVWSLINAIPVGYKLQPMDASRSEVLSEELEFAITGVKRTVLIDGSEDGLEWVGNKR